MSLGRVGELVGRSSGTIRQWERGKSVPTDPAVVRSVAAVLGIDESELFTAAGLPLPPEEEPPTVEDALRTLVSEASQEPRAGRAGGSSTGSVARRAGVPRGGVHRLPAPGPPRGAAGRSYLEDPDQRLAYRLRVLYTVVGLFVLTLVGVWATGNLLRALGDVWNAFFGR